MKIACVSHSFGEYCIRHANVMVDDHDVLLILPANVAQDHLQLIDPRVRYEPFPKIRYRQPIRQLAAMMQVVSKVRRFNPDVVHFQNGHLFFNFALPLLKKYPLVITIHDPRQHLGDREARRTPQFIMDYGFKKADHVIVHGTDLKPIVVEKLGFQDGRVHVIPHIAIGERESAMPVEDDGRTLLFFGRIWGYKGLDYLIQAEPKISAEFPDLRIVIGGRGENMDRYRQMMVHPERFEVHNDWISEEQRSRMFASASVVVLPYVEASQSGVIPVAYNYEKPVIATRVGGLPDMVEDGRTGLLVAPRDSDALAEAAIKLLRDKEKRVAMGRAGKAKLDRECSPEVVVRQTLDVYREAIGDRHLPAIHDGKKTMPKHLCEQAARRVHSFLMTRQVLDGALIGPDPGVRFNYRFWRFIKGLFPRTNWRDNRYYLQAQGYWILANWMLSRADGDNYEKIALAATEQVLRRQRRDGAWEQPNPEWKGRIVTVEGVWASLGLLESYRRSGRTAYLQAALKWHEFLERAIGYQEFAGKIAVNYFANRAEAPVPNNSALVLRYLANLADITGHASYLNKCNGLLRFLQEAQLPSGEVPYIHGNPRRVHFQCFQYQAFLYLDVLEYYRVTGNQQARGVLVRILEFLQNGISPEGFVYYQCGQRRRTVNYHASVVAAAFASAQELGVPGKDELADKAYRYLLRQQGDDGSVPHSRGDYGFLSDRRAYPRYLAMMMFHLLSRSHKACIAPVHVLCEVEVSSLAGEGSL